MKIVVAIDSLKGSLSSVEAGNAIRTGILNVLPQCEVIVKPLADGGEGTTEALVEGLGGELVTVKVHGPLDKMVTASYGWMEESKTAVMEMAAAAGIILVGNDKRPLEATTYGVGEMILDAVKRGCRNFIIGIGGSATNDGGLGMLSALGYEFYDKSGQKVGIYPEELGRITQIRSDHVPEILQKCSFKIACDVTNPLCGVNGATYIYGPQKGVTEEMRNQLDRNLASYAAVTAAFCGKDYSEVPGAGAAGGLGFAFLSFLCGELRSGIDLVLDAVKMDEAMKGADIVFTGEGRLDYQTAMGKAPIGIAKLAKKYGAKVIAFAGAVTEGAEKCNENGIDAYFPILREILTLEEAMCPETAKANMIQTTEQIMRLIKKIG